MLGALTTYRLSRCRLGSAAAQYVALAPQCGEKPLAAGVAYIGDCQLEVGIVDSLELFCRPTARHAEDDRHLLLRAWLQQIGEVIDEAANGEGRLEFRRRQFAHEKDA